MPDYISQRSAVPASYRAGYTTTTTTSTYLGGASSCLTATTASGWTNPRVRYFEAEVGNPKVVISEEAITRSVLLLFSILNEVQAKNIRSFGWFDMIGSDERIYRLLYHRHGNVFRMDKQGKSIEAVWCGHFGENLPVADTLVAQKLMLEVDPEMYTKNANPVSKWHFNLSRPYANYAEQLYVKAS